MISASDLMHAKIIRKRMLTPSVCEFTFTVDDGNLPTFEPGSHITVETPSGAMRRYSLVNDGRNSPENYVIAIKSETTSRGGSLSMHEQTEEGTILRISPPENTFPLKEAADYLLIAGGIGITPIYSMARHLTDLGKSFRIIYCTKNVDDSPYLDELKNKFNAKLLVNHTLGVAENRFDFWDYFAEIKNMHVYCCGPEPLTEEIKAISGHWPEGRVNFEDFKPIEVTRADDVAFKVTLQKSDQTITIPADRSILEAIRDAGIDTISSCESGTCGSCKSRLIKGDVDHRDMVLMDDEKADRIMICVSRPATGDLTIDL